MHAVLRVRQVGLVVIMDGVYSAGLGIVSLMHLVGATLSVCFKRSDLSRIATPTTTPAISAPRIALDNPLRDGNAGSTQRALPRETVKKYIGRKI